MQNKRHKLLFLAFAFPPSQAVGALRAWYLAKYLAYFNWDVTVVTINPDLLATPDKETDVEAKCRRYGINRILTGHDRRFLYGGWLRLRPWERFRFVWALSRKAFERLGVDPGVGWIRPAIRSCADLSPVHADLILATGSPFSSFRIARLLSRRLNVPYVLDYRDLWTQDAHRKYRARRSEVRIESKILHEASGCMTVSEALSECLARSFGMKEHPEVITNGFDPEDLSSVKPLNFDHFSVVYAGSFYEGKRSIQPVIEAVQRANRQLTGRNAFRLHYYGSGGDHVTKISEDLGAAHLVVNHGLVSRDKALAAIKGCHLDVVITSIWNEGSLEDRGVITAKMFDAIGLGSRILLIAPRDSEAAQIVNRLKAGRHFMGSQIEEMAQWLVELCKNGAALEQSGREEFSWPFIARKLDQYLRLAIDRYRQTL